MMLKRVDLPQPEGPMTLRNSPGATASEIWSSAMTAPSGVSNCLTISSTVRMAAPARAAPASGRPVGIVTTAMGGSSFRTGGLARLASPLPLHFEAVYHAEHAAG